MTLRTLTVRGIADITLECLRVRAASNRRSLNGEVLALLDAVTASAPRPSPPVVRESATIPYPATATPEVPFLESVDAAALADVCRRQHIEWLAVFGSSVRGDARADSDVDVVVDFAPGKTPGFGLVRVAEALSPLFGDRRVDLLTRHGLSPRLRDTILSSARTLHGAE